MGRSRRLENSSQNLSDNSYASSDDKGKHSGLILVLHPACGFRQSGEKKASFFDVLGSYSCTEQQAAMIRFLRECQGKPADEMLAAIVTVGEYLGSPTFLSSVEDFLAEESGLVHQHFQDMIEVLLQSKESEVTKNTRTDVIGEMESCSVRVVSWSNEGVWTHRISARDRVNRQCPRDSHHPYFHNAVLSMP
mmetsp:Transcript_11808/g.49204  ORF Transcript_11808/g.49204 Transcript_11808/m.49204 type:complete len:192 (-) Transcript_11808:2396-2971(-)